MLDILVIIGIIGIIIVIADFNIIKKDIEDYNNCSKNDKQNYENH